MAAPPEHTSPRQAAGLPFNLISGFLGAGKTTLLNRLLKHPGMDGTLVIVNEFGEIGLDHALVEASADDIIELTSGCLCCSLRGELADTLIRLLQERESAPARNFSRIVVETSGLADPAPVIHTLMAHPWLAARLRLAGVITVIDAMCGKKTLADHPEALGQVAQADHIVITKADMQGGEDMAAGLRETLRAINPAARLLRADSDDISPENLLSTGPGDDLRHWPPGRTPPDEHRHARHSHAVESFVLAAPNPIVPRGLDIFIDLLRANFGASLLRVKGLVMLSDDPARPLVVHGVRHLFHPPERLPAWPSNIAETRIVIIAERGLRRQVEQLFAAITDPLAGSGAAAGDDTLSLLPDGDA